MNSLQINRKEKTIKIRFNSSLYTAGSLLNSIKDFGSLCDGEMKSEGTDFTVELKCKPHIKESDLANIGHEFCNYALGMMKNKLEV